MRLNISTAMITSLCIIALSAQSKAKPSPPQPEPTSTLKAHPRGELSSTLKSLNSMMHQALGAAVEERRRALGPVIMFEEGKLKLFRGDTEVVAVPASPPLPYHQLKVIGHACFVTVIQLWRAELKAEARSKWLSEFKGHLEALQLELNSYAIPEELRASQAQLLKLTQALIERALTGEQLGSADLKAYSAQAQPHLKAAFTYSAKLHIDLLNQRAGELYAHLSLEERAQVRGYFYGGRGARVDNLGLQYVSWLIGERTGRESERIIFSEGRFTREEALMALAKFRVERSLGSLMFDDPATLHRDVLGEATRRYLNSLPDAPAFFKDSP